MKVTTKAVQEHFACICGRNVVDTAHYAIRWKDLSGHGIVRRKDKKTGQPFLLRRITAASCTCYEET